MARPVKRIKETTDVIKAKKFGNNWDENTRYRAVELYSQVGSLRSVAIAMGLSESTIRHWHIQDWWKEYEDDLKAQKNARTTGQIIKLKDLSVEIVEDRLKNGDYFYDQKTGELVRRPVSADTAASIMRVSLEKHIQLEELRLHERKVESEEKIGDRLKKLGEDFKRFAQAKELKVIPGSEEGTDEEVKVDAIHDQREEGLQEGASLGEEDHGKGSPGRPEREEHGSSDGGEGPGSQTSHI